jgi:hypothetical protein
MADTRYLLGAYVTIEPRSSAARVPITQPLAPRSNVQYSDQYSTDPMYPPDPRYELSKYDCYPPILSILQMGIS